MLARKVTLPELESAALKAGLRLQYWHSVGLSVGRGYRFRLVPMAGESKRHSASQFQRKDGEPRRVFAACWHQFKAFFENIYAENENAVFYTSFAKYDGKAGFEREYPATYYKQTGSMAYPQIYGELCSH